MSTEIQVEKNREAARKLNRSLYKASGRWLLFINLFMGVLVFLPWLAPIFMHYGWESGGRAIHTIYAALCHQLPQRSFFLYGPEPMYSLEFIQGYWQNTSNPLILRQFIGDAAIGWKVAWSDRMVSMYGSIFLFGVLYALVRGRLRPLPFWGLVLLALPMALDGTSHFISDLYGFSNGFRYTNEWLAALTNNAFAPSFYAGNDLGSFNSWMRLITGVLFGLGVVWFAYPHLDSSFRQTQREIEAKFQHAGVEL